MAPVLQDRAFNLNGPSAGFRTTWSSPSDYAFTILLLVGGNVVSMALAQLAGGRLTPVAFSFGESYISSVGVLTSWLFASGARGGKQMFLGVLRRMTFITID